MPITTALCNSWKAEALRGVHGEADTYMIALYTSAATLNKSTTAYTATDEVSGAGYDAGGKVLSGYSVALTGDVGHLSFTDPVWPASSIAAAGCLIYNASKSNAAVGVFSFGQTVTSTNGDFTVNLPTPGASTSLVRIA